MFLLFFEPGGGGRGGGAYLERILREKGELASLLEQKWRNERREKGGGITYLRGRRLDLEALN